MATNFPGPYGLRIFYTVDGRDHKQELNIDLTTNPAPGVDFADVDVVTIGAQEPTLEAYTDAWAALLLPFMDDTLASFTHAELWEYEAGTFNANYVGTYDLSLAGTNTGTVSPASEGIYTFRTVEGSTMKIVLEDTNTAPGVSQTYAAMGSSSKALVDFVLGDGGGFLGRDTSFPVAFFKYHPGQNERNWKAIYR